MQCRDCALICNSSPFCAFCFDKTFFYHCVGGKTAFLHSKMWCLSRSIFYIHLSMCNTAHIAVLIRIHSTGVQQHVLQEDKSWTLKEYLCPMHSTRTISWVVFFCLCINWNTLVDYEAMGGLGKYIICIILQNTTVTFIASVISRRDSVLFVCRFCVLV